MDRYVSIGEAARILGVSVSTLRRWDREGKISSIRTTGNQRRYDIRSLCPGRTRDMIDRRITIAYARVSDNSQKEDLERQKQVLELYCSSQGWIYEVISDFGSGMNYHKKGLKRLISEIINGKVSRLVITHRDRLLRFGAELIFALCEARSIEIVILNQGEDTSFEEDLTKDVSEIISVFSARLYGSRSRKNQKLLEGVKKVVEEVSM